MRTMLAALLALVPSLANAASLYPPMPAVAYNQPTYVVLADGTRLEGQVRSAVLGEGGAVRKLTFVTDSGEKHKLAASDVQELGNKPGDLMKLAARSEASDSVAAHNTYDGRAIPEWIVWKPVAHPKNDKVFLMQELNPEFDSRIAVYADPKAQETGGVAVGGIQMTGGVEKSYVVVKDDSGTLRVEKHRYEQQYDALFGDCSTLEKPQKIDWKDFGDHVKAYEEACPAN
jgi:hypothetical protein